MRNFIKRPTHILKLLALLIPLSVFPSGTVLALDGAAKSNAAAKNRAPFPARENAMADVDALLERASAKGKLGLIIMGGNWCHDSQALVRRMSTPELAPILDENYESMLVDVAGLSDNMDVAKRFGRPVIYGTPTVLIVDPATKQLVNAHDMHQWRDAERISLEETTQYFAKMANSETRGTPAELAGNAQYEKFAAGIAAFERAQSERLYAAFKVVGPMLMMKPSERPANFGKLWIELSKFRYQITNDLSALDAEARSIVSNGDVSGKLSYPSYNPFSWE